MNTELAERLKEQEEEKVSVLASSEIRATHVIKHPKNICPSIGDPTNLTSSFLCT